MLRSPNKTPLAPQLTQLLAADGCQKLLQVPASAEGECPTFLCPSLTSLDGITLALSLDHERSDLSRGLVRGLWFDQPLTLWLCGGGEVLRANVWAYRCHIVGPVLTGMLALARRQDPTGDIACAWQLVVQDWEMTDQCPPRPQPLPDGPPELHFDNPLLLPNGRQ